jgi:hypothetical protein
MLCIIASDALSLSVREWGLCLAEHVMGVWDQNLHTDTQPTTHLTGHGSLKTESESNFRKGDKAPDEEWYRACMWRISSKMGSSSKHVSSFDFRNCTHM